MILGAAIMLAVTDDPSLPVRDIVERCRGGDSIAREEFYHRTREPITRFVSRMLSDPDAAADAVQETYVRILAGLDRFRGASDPLTWALGIAANVCREHYRRKARDPRPAAVDPPAPDASPLEAASLADEATRIARRIEMLPPGEREVLVLRATQGWCYERIAQATGRTLADVKVTLYRARRRLLESDR